MTVENILIYGIPALLILLLWVIKVLRRIAFAQEITAKLTLYDFVEKRGGEVEAYVSKQNALKTKLKTLK